MSWTLNVLAANVTAFGV
ncbi:hypothetical protein Q5N31_17960 [Vibrio cholerae]|nr:MULTISPECIES: hypothetical protein [Vibrio]MDT8797186.1 hypothetical protein [Vibrio cholerae]MDT8830432.1 hypothetical protein [Vibrio cholerae]MDV2322900.1 hypothetical protein [Vibrio cholerae]